MKYFAWLIFAHLVDIHVSSPKEEAMIEAMERQIKVDEATETLADENASEEDKFEATLTLIEEGEMV